MSYSTYSPIHREVLATLKPKNRVFYFESENFIKSRKKDQKESNILFKAHKLKPKVKQSNTKKTMPLVSFVNLLMKDGKKTHALRILSMTLFLFKTRIFKIKLEKHFDCLKQSRNFIGYFLKCKARNLDKPPFQKCISNYSIEERNFYYVFSTCKDSMQPSNLRKNISLGLSSSNSIFPWFLKYKKVFPFFFDFFFLTSYFYGEKKFFCGKFINLKRFYTIKKILKNWKVLDNKKENKKSLKKTFVFKSTRNVNSPLESEVDKAKNSLNLSKRQGNERLSSKAFSCFSFFKETSNFPLSFYAKLFSFKLFLNLKEQTVNQKQKVEKKDKTHFSLKKCMWYKTLGKKASWENLTTAQKNLFFYCLYKAISNVKPPLECRTKRIGGSNKQIPSQVSEHRQWGLALRWIIEYAENEFSKKKNKTLGQKDFYRVNSKLILKNSENNSTCHEKSKFPRGSSNLALSLSSKTREKTIIASKAKGVLMHAMERPLKEKQFISSLLQNKPKGSSLKEHYPKTKFLYFCFFLAESLENAYYKRGLAMQKRNLWVETALANRAFLRYRWW